MKQVAGENKDSFGLEVCTMNDGTSWVSLKSFCGFLESTAQGLIEGKASSRVVASNLKMSAARLWEELGMPEWKPETHQPSAGETD